MTTGAGTEDPTPRPAGDELLERAEQPEGALPETLPVLPLKETVVFPEAMAPLAVGEERSIRLIDEVLNGPDRLLALVVSKDPEASAPGPDQLHEIGTVAVVQRMVRVPDGTVRILAQGLRRVRLGPYTQTEPFLVAHVEEVPDHAERTTEVEALTRNLQGIFSRMIELVPHLPDELRIAVANMEDPTTLSYVIAASMRLSTEERQELLEEADLEARLRRLTVLCTRELELLELGAKIQSDVRLDLDKGQREYFLRQQLKAIREELGEGDDEQAEIEELRGQLVDADPPELVRTAAERELSRLERLPQASAEYGVVRTYLDWILSLPWNTVTDDDLDLTRARTVLDEDHYDIQKVKDRILEHLAVARLKSDAAGPILCFVGPPGVGKTSVGQSIARALGRRFARISVGGVRDEAEIRGHRRTYVGAMPGTIVRAIRDAGAMNPVIMVDEIDKMGADFRGDPSSAMLEVLDPAQNSTLPGPLPRPAARPLPGALPVHGERARHDSAGPARPDGGDPALGLHRGGEAPHRAALPAAPPDRGGRAARGDAGGDRRRPADGDRRVHPGGRGPPARAPAGRDRPAHRGAGGRGGRRPRGRGRGPRPGDPGPRAHPQRGEAPHERAGGGHRPRRDRRRGRDPVRGGPGHAGQRAADRDRPARRRDEGVGAGGPLVRPRPRRGPGPRSGRGLLLRPRRPPARAGRGGAQGRPVGRRDDGHRAWCRPSPGGR